jgi:hypothetical protein
MELTYTNVFIYTIIYSIVSSFVYIFIIDSEKQLKRSVHFNYFRVDAKKVVIDGDVYLEWLMYSLTTLLYTGFVNAFITLLFIGFLSSSILFYVSLFVIDVILSCLFNPEFD